MKDQLVLKLAGIMVEIQMMRAIVDNKIKLVKKERKENL